MNDEKHHKKQIHPDDKFINPLFEREVQPYGHRRCGNRCQDPEAPDSFQDYQGKNGRQRSQQVEHLIKQQKFADNLQLSFIIIIIIIYIFTNQYILQRVSMSSIAIYIISCAVFFVILQINSLLQIRKENLAQSFILISY